MTQRNPVLTNSFNTVADDAIDALFGDLNESVDDRINELCSEFLSSDDSIDKVANMHELRQLFCDVQIPDTHWGMDDYLDMLAKNIIPHSSHLTAPTYIGHMTSPLPSFVRQLSKLVMVMNQNMMKMESCRGLSFLERQVLGMLHREVYGREDSFYNNALQGSSLNLGCFTSGGTIANITAMWLALKTRQNRRAIKEGQQGVIIGSELLHYSFDKAADVLGLRLLRLPITADYKISILELQRTLRQCEIDGVPVVSLIAVAGATDFGSVDPLAEMSAIARQYHVHLHVDAAWGGSMLLCDEGRALLSGIALADSVTVDGHKQLMIPLGCGMLFTREAEALQNIRKHAPYAIRSTSLDQGRFTLEGSRPNMALYLHAAFHLMGRERYSLLMESSLARTRELAKMLNKNEAFEVMHRPQMNLLVFRYIPASMRGRDLSPADNDWISAFNTLLQKRLRAQGSSFVSRTSRCTHRYRNQSLVMMRAVLLNPLTRTHHLQQVIRDLLRLGRQLERELADGDIALEVA